MGVINVFKGITFCSLWYFSIVFGFMTLYCPLMPLVFMSNAAFRTITDKIFAFWELYPTALLQLLFGTKIYVHGDYVDPGETSLVVMNHRTRVDWNYVWLCMFHATRRQSHQHEGNHGGTYDALQNGGLSYQNGGYNINRSNGRVKALEKKKSDWNLLAAFNQRTRMKFVLKNEIRHIPGPGWVMQVNCFIYIMRKWEEDEQEILRVAQYLHDIGCKYQLLIFPEGTDLTETNIRKSDSFAKKNNFPMYRHVLHPRTRGFCHLVRAMGSDLAAVYDITVAYGGCDGCRLRDLLLGRFPPEVHFSIKRYPANSLPSDEVSLGRWLNERWKSKEEQLKDFHKHGRFVDASNRLEYLPRGELITALIFWTVLVLSCPALLCCFPMLRNIAMMWCGVFVFGSVVGESFHHLEMLCFSVKNYLQEYFTEDWEN